MNFISQFIGRRIVFFRKIQGISQVELAKEVSVKKEDLAAIENGKKEPSVSNLFRISRFLKTKIEYFFPQKKEHSDLLTLYPKLNKNNQEKIFRYAKELLENQNKIINLYFKNDQTNSGPKNNLIRIPIEADFIFHIIDDSMEDIIDKGSTLFCRTQPTIKDGEIAILEVIRIGIVCRKVLYDFEEEHFILKPLNEKYPEISYEQEQIKIIGKVLNF
ncbi:LexA family transcriptional regulator [Jeotgalibaca sp. MA1X17-3]|uniref:helix-turn-helix domain-containing protein n=1 Tax=Jeotgalibaca sp. MA1X17-3 TaxID=2908211 RepID=UPI001F478AB4|nr:LexA family transcriptional regulator [Jeotgalibaca sp. MA1X17-3]UJF14687.1 LexA family transcriptional regulator [Jeotgalibaca sp. MA1X17-3]